VKLAFYIPILTVIMGPAPAFAARSAAGTRIVIQVDTNAGAVRVDKVRHNTTKHIQGRSLPIVKDSWKAGWYRPIRLERKFRTVNGNTYLENVIFLAGSRTIRTSRYFNRIAADKTPVSGTVVLEPDFGSILFETVSRYGTANTWIHIRK